MGLYGCWLGDSSRTYKIRFWVVVFCHRGSNWLVDVDLYHVNGALFPARKEQTSLKIVSCSTELQQLNNWRV